MSLVNQDAMIGELRRNDTNQPMAEQMAQLNTLIGQKDSQLQVDLLRSLFIAELWLLCACSRFLMLHKSQTKYTCSDSLQAVVYLSLIVHKRFCVAFAV